MKVLLDKIKTKQTLTNKEMKYLLELSNIKDKEALYKAAYKVKSDTVGQNVYFRGIIEMSNYCIKDCYYCGIRKSNTNVERYEMSEEEVITSAVWAYQNDYGSIVLQTGERTDETFINSIESLLKKIKKVTNHKLGITLSLGEQTKETYERWFNAGGHRYLLRIETSNKDLYKKLHPDDHCFEKRIECLKNLKTIGYQVGTGVMIGLPNQTSEHLVNDINFFKKIDIDMIGMGPFLPHSQAPVGKDIKEFDNNRQLEIALNMIAVTRLSLPDINIAATTALQALDHVGREKGLMAGANIIMPNITSTKYRKNYQLYENKPCLDENSSLCKGCLNGRISKIGEKIGYKEWGDSLHFLKKKTIV